MTATSPTVLELDDRSEVDTIWFVGDGQTMDWMAALQRVAPDQPWRLRYRFRYYAGPSPWDSGDRKNYYEMVLTDPVTPEKLAQVVTVTDQIADLTLARCGPTGRKWRLPIHGGRDAALAVLRQQPWFFSREEERTDV